MTTYRYCGDVVVKFTYSDRQACYFVRVTRTDGADFEPLSYIIPDSVALTEKRAVDASETFTWLALGILRNVADRYPDAPIEREVRTQARAVCSFITREDVCSSLR